MDESVDVFAEPGLNINVSKVDLRSILGKVQGITGRKTNLAITENVLIETTGAGISIKATDFETGYVGMFPATVETEGRVALNAKKLFEIVRDFPSESINLNEIENRWIEIRNQKVEYHIVGMNPDDFPEVETLEDVSFFEMPSATLRRMLERTAFIMGSTEDRRPHITGVFLEDIRDEETGSVYLQITSTDGSRLSTVTYPYSGEGPIPEQGILIPKKALHEVQKFLGSEGMVKFGVQGSHLVVQKELETLTVRLLEGEFPNFRSILHIEGGHEIRLDRQLFLMMLRRMSILAVESYWGVIFSFEPDLMVIRATNPDIGESKEEMAIEYDGEPMEIGFNPKFFVDALNLIEEEHVVLRLLDAEKPCLVRGVEDDTYLSVIMPIKL